MLNITHHFHTTTHLAPFFPALPSDQPLHIWVVGSLRFMRIHQFLFWLGLSFNPLGSAKSHKKSLNVETRFQNILYDPFLSLKMQSQNIRHQEKKNLEYEAAIQVRELTQWEAIESMRGVL